MGQRNSFNEMLNVLQSACLPFAMLPLLHLARDERLMGRFANGPRLNRVVTTAIEVRAVVAEPVADEDRRRLDAAAVPQQAPVLAAEAAELVAVAAVGAAGAEELAAVERRVDGRVVEAGAVSQNVGTTARRGEAHRRDERRQAPQRGHLGELAGRRISGSPCLAGFPCSTFTSSSTCVDV